MENNRITFIGSSNINSSRASQPGECSTVVNLTQLNSSLRPIASYGMAGGMTGTTRKIVFIHTHNNKQHLISVDNTSVYHEADIDNNYTSGINQLLASLEDCPTDFNAIGNTLVVTTASKVLFFIYRNNCYTALGDKPPMPIIRFREKHIDNRGYVTETAEFPGRLEKLSEENYEFITNHILGPLYKVRDEIHEQNGFFEPVAIRYALRLFDGRHILPSPPVVVNFYNYQQLLEERLLVFYYKSSANKTTLLSDTILWGIMGIEYIAEEVNLGNWGDIVTGIDIFISKEISLIEDRPINDGIYYDMHGDKIEYGYKYHIPLFKEASIEMNTLNDTLFYHLATIKIDEIVPHEPTLIKHDIRPNNIIYRPLMEVDTSTFDQIGAMHTFVYNNRLHLANVKRSLFTGYHPAVFCASYDNNNNDASIHIRTHIALGNEGAKVVDTYMDVPFFSGTLSPLISYPNSNATSMDITIIYNGYYYHKSITLKSIDNENRASYIHPQIKCIDINEWEKRVATDDDINNLPSSSYSTPIEQRNLMLVSQINNPFSFPNELAYYISGGSINGIATTTAALSQGQFGEFPLYVFTSEGIWSMQVGTEDICYTRCTPINNERTKEQGLIVPTQSAIIYRSGNNISVISGAESSVLLPLTEISTINFNEQKSKLLPQLSPAGKDHTPILEYLDENAVAIYNHSKDELILCNNRFPYCWILHLPSRHLYRWEQAVRGIVSSGNTILFQGQNNIIYNLNNEITSIKDVCLITKPIQLLPDAYTRLRQVIWRMHSSQGVLSLCILASHEPDGTYRPIYRATYEGYINGHLPLRIFSAPYKYFRIALSGSVSPDFTIDCADLAYDIVGNNKLR